LFADLALGVLDLAVALFFADLVVDTNSKRSLLSVAESDGDRPSLQVDVNDQQSRLAEIMQLEDAPLLQHRDAIGRLPLILRFHVPMILPDLFTNYPAMAFALRPEINPLNSALLVLQNNAFRDDIAVTKPNGFLMHMVGRAAGRRLLHRPAAGHHYAP